MTNRLLGIWLGLLTVLMGALVLVQAGDFGAPIAGAAAPTGEIPKVIVSGQGRASAQPTVAKLDVGVETTAATVSQAVADNQAQMAAVVGSLKAAGIDAKDIQTSNYSIYPQREQSMKGTPGAIIGYQVSNNVSITVRRIETISQVLDQVTRAGATNVHSLRFTIDDTRALEDEARIKALADAKRKAEALAKQSGLQVGPVLQLRESRGSMPVPLYEGAMLADAKGGGAGPIEAGELEVVWTVEVTHELK